MQKILILIAVVLTAVSAVLGFLNTSKLRSLRVEIAQTNQDLDQSKKTLTKTSSDLKNTKEKLTSTTSDLEKSSADLLEARGNVEKATSETTDLQKQITQKEADLAQQKSDLQAKTSRIAELESKQSNTGAQAPSVTDELKKQLDEAAIIRSSLESKLKESTDQLAALRQHEADRKKKAMRAGLVGKVLAVNQAWNFVVLSLGDHNGVISNAEMLIKRGTQLMGKVRITEVEPSTSIADIVVNSVPHGFVVEPGDSVIYMGPDNDGEFKP